MFRASRSPVHFQVYILHSGCRLQMFQILFFISERVGGFKVFICSWVISTSQYKYGILKPEMRILSTEI